MIQKKSDDAISPVIGVMLMIVVTVVIAAVVTAFATGVVGETEPAPVAVLDVEIISQARTLGKVVGPEFFITHISGDPVDTANIEIHSSWSCGVAGCSYGGVHTSSYSAEECEKEFNNGIEGGPSAGFRKQALYVKALMKNKDGDMVLDHYFGEVTLTPGLKLTAQSEFLEENVENTGSAFMDVIFDNYRVTRQVEEIGREEGVLGHEVVLNTHNIEDHYEEFDENCPNCQALPEEWKFLGCEGSYRPVGYCIVFGCYHPATECTGDNKCGCAITGERGIYTITHGIMDHLQPGTAVDIMIVHTPSGKAIYDNTVIVQ